MVSAPSQIHMEFASMWEPRDTDSCSKVDPKFVKLCHPSACLKCSVVLRLETFADHPSERSLACRPNFEITRGKQRPLASNTMSMLLWYNSHRSSHAKIKPCTKTFPRRNTLGGLSGKPVLRHGGMWGNWGLGLQCP